MITGRASDEPSALDGWQPCAITLIFCPTTQTLDWLAVGQTGFTRETIYAKHGKLKERLEQSNQAVNLPNQAGGRLHGQNVASLGFVIEIQRNAPGVEMVKHRLDPSLDRRMVRTVAGDEFLDNGPQRHERQLRVGNAHWNSNLPIASRRLLVEIDDRNRKLLIAREPHADSRGIAWSIASWIAVLFWWLQQP